MKEASERRTKARVGFHQGLDLASVRREALKGQSSFSSATRCFVKAAANSPSTCSAGCGQLQHPCGSKPKAMSSLQSPSSVPRGEWGEAKPEPKLDEQGGSSPLCSGGGLGPDAKFRHGYTSYGSCENKTQAI